MMSREGHGEEENGGEGAGGDGDIVGAAQRAPRHFDQRLDDDDEHRRLDAEKGRLDQGDLAEKGISDAERENDDGARQHEQEAGGKPSGRTMEAPADIGGELHRLGTGQEHAEVQCVQERLRRNPAALIDQKPMHQRNLACRTAERQDADLGPQRERFGKTRLG